MTHNLKNDRNIIERKYHLPEQEFNPFLRWEHHGYEYDAATGLDDAQIQSGLDTLSQELAGQPHPIFKAKLFAYVLDNTRIDVNEHDYFIGIYTWNRPISKYTVAKWYQEVKEQFPTESKLLSDYSGAGISVGGLDFDHTVPNWDDVLTLGFHGLLKRADKYHQELKEAGTVTEKQEHFFMGVEIELQAILRLIDRLYRYALTKTFDKAPVIADCLKHLHDGAPTNTYEALQLIYIYFMISEHIENYQVRSLGHGLDNTLYPFYQQDISNQKYTKADIGEFIGYFLMQWSAIGNYWGQPLYLGGMNYDGTTKVNELSYLILDTYDKLGIYNPKIQIKVNRTTPKDFVCKALEMIRHGVSSIVFCNNDVITKCLMSRGATYEVAVDSVISGCYEYKKKARDIGIGGMTLNALKPISLVLDNGFDFFTQKNIGVATGNLEDLTSFEHFYQAYLKQLKFFTLTAENALNKMMTRIDHANPSLMFSSTIPDCMRTLTDALDCGIENYTCILLSGLGTAVDALMAVYELVYEKRLVTLVELNNALHSNWEGYENLRQMALHATHKYGNNDPSADYYAASIVRFMSDIFSGHTNSHGGPYVLEIHSARAFINQGRKTIATPDGRKTGEETSKNASPTPGADRKGITALIQSAAQIDTTLCNDGLCLDAILHPSSAQGTDGLESLYAILTTYMSKGGASIQFNIFDSEMLRDAQKHPEKYKNLQVRVCGWNVLWNDMTKSEQDAYILRADIQ